MVTIQGIAYNILESSKADEAAKLLIENFFPNEPISRALGLPTEQVLRWFPQQIRDCVKQNCSIQAVDTKSGNMVGVAINILIEKDLNRSDGNEGRGLLGILNPETESVMVEIAKFLNVLNQVPDEVYSSGVDNKGKFTSLNCIYLNVLGTFGGKGIGKMLVQQSERIAIEKGVAFMQVDTTSEFSYQIFHKHCGFPVVREIPLSGYLRNIGTIDNGVHKSVAGRLFQGWVNL